MIEIKCPQCEKLLHIPYVYAEQTGVCNACQYHLTVPTQPCTRKLFTTCSHFCWISGTIEISTFKCRLKGIEGQEVDDLGGTSKCTEKDENADMCLGCTDYKELPYK